MKKTNIIITFQLEGFHHWANAPEEVAFLRDNHRHIFWFEVEKEVSHADRDIEIIMFKRRVQKFIEHTYTWRDENLQVNLIQFGQSSCEMLAEKILDHFNCERVKVMEDNENGAVVYKITPQTLL